jgi:putative ABC transport system ATP-binding protein
LIESRGLAKDSHVGPHVVHALRDVSIIVHHGEFVAVVGPAGSGKSTFLNLVGCLDSPTEGTYFLDGRDVSHLSWDAQADVRNKKIGFVFQTFNLLPRMTALENVERPLVYTDPPPRERRALARAVLAAVGLTGRAHHHPVQLSGGQQQRVGIAGALVNDPVLVLADEPTGNLDTQTSAEVMTIFEALNRRGITIMLVTHEPDIAGHAGRVISFRDGVVIADEATAAPRPAGPHRGAGPGRAPSSRRRRSSWRRSSLPDPRRHRHRARCDDHRRAPVRVDVRAQVTEPIRVIESPGPGGIGP